MKNKNSHPLTLIIVTSEGTLPEINCDSVRLNVRDDKDGKGGGSCSIRKGHAKALIATDDGIVTAYADGENIFSTPLGSGFCSVENNTITVISAT